MSKKKLDPYLAYQWFIGFLNHPDLKLKRTKTITKARMSQEIIEECNQFIETVSKLIDTKLPMWMKLF